MGYWMRAWEDLFDRLTWRGALRASSAARLGSRSSIERVCSLLACLVRRRRRHRDGVVCGRLLLQARRSRTAFRSSRGGRVSELHARLIAGDTEATPVVRAQRICVYNQPMRRFFPCVRERMSITDQIISKRPDSSFLGWSR